MQLDGPAGESFVGIELAEDEIGVGHRRFLTTAAITRRSGLRAGRLGADPNLAHGIHMGQRAAAGTNFHHVDHRDGYRHAGALLEAVGARHFENPTGPWRLVLDQADLGRGAAHVEGQHLVQAVARSDVCRKDRAAGRSGLNQTNRKFCRTVEGNDPAAGVHQKDRTVGTLLRAGDPQAGRDRTSSKA